MLKVIPLLEPYNLALPMSYNVDRGLLGSVTGDSRPGWAASKMPPRCHPRHSDSLLAGCFLVLSHCCSFLDRASPLGFLLSLSLSSFPFLSLFLLLSSSSLLFIAIYPLSLSPSVLLSSFLFFFFFFFWLFQT